MELEESNFQPGMVEPNVGRVPNSMMSTGTWIIIVGIPLHLWSQKVFQDIGSLCGGWMVTKEETELKNHMKWARILVSNDGRNIPKEVVRCRNGLSTIPDLVGK